VSEPGEHGSGDDGAPFEGEWPAIDRARAVDPRILAAWREWLRALATDAEAAIAAAHVYGELAPPAREAWLDALIEDSPKLSVPLVAVYAPLLAVESDPARRDRIERAIADDGLPDLDGPRPIRALQGIAPDGARVLALVSPLYLSFVQVLWCRYSGEGFEWVRHDPILRGKDAPTDGVSADGVILDATPLTPVVEDLAHAVLAQRRRGLELPRPLQLFAHLFDARLDDESSLGTSIDDMLP
jgi:hypothetical protein